MRNSALCVRESRDFQRRYFKDLTMGIPRDFPWTSFAARYYMFIFYINTCKWCYRIKWKSELSVWCVHVFWMLTFLISIIWCNSDNKLSFSRSVKRETRRENFWFFFFKNIISGLSYIWRIKIRLFFYFEFF